MKTVKTMKKVLSVFLSAMIVIACCITAIATTPSYTTATDFYTAWYQSPGHYRNMTNPNFTQIGITIYQDPTTGYRYAAMELARVVEK